MGRNTMIERIENEDEELIKTDIEIEKAYL